MRLQRVSQQRLSLLLQGFVLGGVATVLWLGAGAPLPGGVSLAQTPSWAASLEGLLEWAHLNLRGSLVPFTLVLLLFFHAVERLHGQLRASASLESIAQAEHWAELWTSVFFGIGVIWTAIGMRSALLAGLGNLDSAVAAEVGAFAILQRLVDGGILLALSTTIVGGVGGYLMRVYKGLRVGALLRRCYAENARRSEQAVLIRLDRLEGHLALLSERTEPIARPPVDHYR